MSRIENDVAVMVATHKEYNFPEDDGYFPVHVGKALGNKRLPYIGDNEGENISSLNKSFCELTGLYWLWKNSDSSFYGLSHYRRYFKSKDNELVLNGKGIASTKELVRYLGSSRIILPKPRNYVIETVRKHYENAHNPDDLKVVESVLRNNYPDYMDAFNKVMGSRKLSLYNMFFMHRKDFNNYCFWLFSVLFEVKKLIDIKEYGPYQGRVFGFLAERLMNVWVEKNFSKNNIVYLPVVNIEGENLAKKAVGLLKRKITGLKNH